MYPGHFRKCDISIRHLPRLPLHLLPYRITERQGITVTISEASERYHIPMEILRQYESWGLCGAVKKVMGSWQYDDTDLENLSMIMTLHDIGFTARETETYMKLLLEGSSADGQRLRMLNEKRNAALDEIHFREKQLDRLDYLRHTIRKENPERKSTAPKG